MKLRGFLILLGLTALAVRAADPTPSAARQYYQLRVYSTQSPEQLALVADYWKVAVPAYNRAGIEPVGVFTEAQDTPTNRIYVLVPFDSLAELDSLPGKLDADTEYQKAAAGFMNRSKNEAPYTRLDVTLLTAMKGMPKLALPPSSANKDPWIFELRTYISPTEVKGANKIAMFEDGEIEVMKEVGLNPVFFAGTIAGPQMPNLIYMVSAKDMDEHKQHWRAFGPHPVWKKMAADPKYKDNMTGIQNVFLKRTEASQI